MTKVLDFIHALMKLIPLTWLILNEFLFGTFAVPTTVSQDYNDYILGIRCHEKAFLKHSFLIEVSDVF